MIGGAGIQTSLPSREPKTHLAPRLTNYVPPMAFHAIVPDSVYIPGHS